MNDRMNAAYGVCSDDSAFTWEPCGETPDVRCQVVGQARRCLYAYRLRKECALADTLPAGVPASVMVDAFPRMLGMLYGNIVGTRAARGWTVYRVRPWFQWLMRWLLFKISKHRMVDLPPWRIMFMRGFIRSGWCVWDLLRGKRMMCPALLYKAWPEIEALEAGQSVVVECPDEKTLVAMRFTRP